MKKIFDILISFAPSIPIHSEHSAAHFWYNGCSPELLSAKDRQKPRNRYYAFTIFLCFFLCQISCTNFWLDRRFQASAQT